MNHNATGRAFANRVPVDALNHEALANTLLRAAELYDPGAVISIEGSWGRGKTDVLKRMVERSRSSSKFLSPVLWVDPWEYQEQDLLLAIINELGHRFEGLISEEQAKALWDKLLAWWKGSRRIVDAIPSFPSAAANAGVGTLRLMHAVAPNNHIPESRVESSRRFRDLVNEYIAEACKAERNARDGKKILVCIDDVDRCHPSAQIQIIECVHFLSSQMPMASFVLGIDSATVQSAIHSYYSATVNASRYLDKMIDLRVPLPPLRVEEVRAFSRAEIERNSDRGIDIDGAFAGIGNVANFSISSWVGQSIIPEVTNPRTIRRIIDRLALVIANDVAKSMLLKGIGNEINAVKALVSWMALVELWPDFRVLFTTRHKSVEQHRLVSFCKRYYSGSRHESGMEAVDLAIRDLGLPNQDHAHAATLNALFSEICPSENMHDEVSADRTVYFFVESLKIAGV